MSKLSIKILLMSSVVLGAYAVGSPIFMNAQNNFWGDSTGPYHPTLNSGGLGNRVSDNVLFIPWLQRDPLKPPTISNLSQFKSEGITPITESGITTEDTVVFKAILNSPINNQVKLEVEIRQFSEPFTGQYDGGIISSSFVESGNIASATRYGLIDGQYHWRARVKDVNGNVSNWIEFGAPGNVDFEIKLVPLYTQMASDYPSRNDTERWSVLKYGNGNYSDCFDSVLNFSAIRNCGCAITSSVMLLRYYDINTAFDNKLVDPANFNDWLNNNEGYDKYGNLDWPKVSEYSKDPQSNFVRILYGSRFDIGDVFGTTFNNLTAITDVYLDSHEPVIIRSRDFGHFFVANEKLSTTYAIRDPAWFNTKTLDSATTSRSLKIRDYNNQFSGIRLYYKVSHLPDGISFGIASPAELLITDPQGRRLGKDSINNISYHEIPNAFYGPDGISDADTEIPLQPYEVKNAWISHSETGRYLVQVIGTATGTYAFKSFVYDASGNSHHQTFEGTTQTNQITPFNANVTLDQPENINVQPVDDIPPEAKIYFDPETKTLKVEGTDNITSPAPTVTQSDKTFIIQDAADNTLTLQFKELKQKKEKIEAELKILQYNVEPKISLPETKLGFNWSIDKKTNKIKELKQSIEVENQFKIEANYNSKKNETEIKIEREKDKNNDNKGESGDKNKNDENNNKDKKKEKLTLPGLVIIKLVTQSGELSYELFTFAQTFSLVNPIPNFFLTATISDTFLGEWASLFLENVKSVAIKLLQFLGLYLESVKDQKQADISPSSVHEPCLGDEEIAELVIYKNNYGPSSAAVIVKQKESHAVTYEFKIDNVVADHYHLYEIHQCGIYVVREFNYDYRVGKTLPDFRMEIWRYSYDGGSRRILEENDFRVDQLEKYIIFEQNYFGQPDYALVIKNLATQENVFTIGVDDMKKINTEIETGSINMGKFTEDGKYLWGTLFIGALDTAYYRIELATWKTEIFSPPSDIPSGAERATSFAGYVVYVDYPTFFGISIIAEQEQERFRKEGLEKHLYLYNLRTKEKRLLTTTSDPEFRFDIQWISDNELRYLDPEKGEVIYKIQ